MLHSKKPLKFDLPTVKRSVAIHEKTSEKDELRALNKAIAAETKRIRELEKHCKALRVDHKDAAYENFVKNSEVIYKWLLRLFHCLVKEFPEKKHANILKQAIDFCCIKTNGIWDGSLQKNIYLIDILIQVWNDAACFYQSTNEDVNDKNYNFIVTKLNAEPNKHHFKRMVGLILSEIYHKNFALSDNIAVRMNIGFFELNKDNTYGSPKYPRFEDASHNVAVKPGV